jgi:mono/diheme cytochrome c family protein
MKTRPQRNVSAKLTPLLARAALYCLLGCSMTIPLAIHAESGSGSNSGSGSGSGFNAGSNSGPGSGKGSAVEGRRKFLEMNCYGCHGGRGGGGMGPNIRDDRPNDNRIADAVLNGRPTGMPSYRGLVSAQDIENLIAYIRSLRRDEEPVFTHWWELVPTR